MRTVQCSKSARLGLHSPAPVSHHGHRGEGCDLGSDPEQANSRGSADHHPHNRAASPALKGDLGGASPCTPPEESSWHRVGIS